MNKYEIKRNEIITSTKYISKYIFFLEIVEITYNKILAISTPKTLLLQIFMMQLGLIDWHKQINLDNISFVCLYLKIRGSSRLRLVKHLV